VGARYLQRLPVALLAAGCACRGPAAPPTPAPAEAASTADTTPTGEDSATATSTPTADTATSTQSTSSTGDTAQVGGGATVVEIDPSASVIGLPEMLIHIDGPFLLPAYGGHPGVIVVSNHLFDPDSDAVDLGMPEGTIVSGDLPPGEHPIVEVWDGTSGLDVNHPMDHAGDVNGDGHLDAWLSNRYLHLGPFLGAYVEDYAADAFAWFDSHNDSDIHDADHDLDGDGHTDVVVSGHSQTAIIHYGPFEGEIPTFSDNGFDPARMSVVAGGCGGGAEIIEDVLGPGQHILATGLESWYCSWDYVLFDAMQPRGSWVGMDDHLANEQSFSNNYLIPDPGPGDLNGDGHADLLVVSDGRYGALHAGPFGGGAALEGQPDAIPLEEDLTDLGYEVFINRSVPDLNGDGMVELLAVVGFPDGHWYDLVMFSPFDGSAHPLASGVAIYSGGVYYKEGVYTFLERKGFAEDYLIEDLDGDGLYDIIMPYIGATEEERKTEAGRIDIFYGADVAAAWDEAVGSGSTTTGN